jgi:hypothetical protein
MIVPTLPSLSDFAAPDPTATPYTLPVVIILANTFWLWSLLLGISCALVALSLPLCAKLHTGTTLPHHSLHEQTRMRTLFAARIERLNFDFHIGALHCVVHVAFTLFLAGLHLYFWDVSYLAFLTSIIWSAICLMVYLWLTILPIIRPGSPYSTPFSKVIVKVITNVCGGDLHGNSRLHTSPNCISEAIQGAVRHPKGKRASPLDDEVLKRTLDLLRSDDDLEQFFEAIPGFCDSKMIDNPRRSLDILGRQRLAQALVEFWNRTLSSNRVSESVGGRRLIVCVRVIEAAELSFAVPQFLDLFSRDLRGVSRSAKIGHSLRNGNAASLARGIIASIISINDGRDKHWFTLTMGELGISKDVLRRYLDHGDSVLLADLIHITRQFSHSLDLDLTRKSLSILPSLSRFDIHNTLLELQHDFCALWNEIVQQAQSSGTNKNPFIDILIEIQGLYVALHCVDAPLTTFFATTTSQEDLLRQPASYHLCMMPDHHRNLTTHIQEAGGGGTTGGARHSTITELIHHPGESSRPVIVANQSQLQDRDSSENTA